MIPRIVYRGTALPEKKPSSKKFPAIFTTPYFEDAKLYGHGHATDEYSRANQFYVQEYEIKDSAKIVNLNKDEDAGRIVEKYAGREIRSQEEFDEILEQAAEWARRKFIKVVTSFGYDGYYFYDAPMNDTKVVIFDPSDLILKKRYISRFIKDEGWTDLKQIFPTSL